MIHLLSPEDQFPDTGKCQEWSNKIAKAYNEFTTLKIQEALITKFGFIPSTKEIVKHMYCVIDKDQNHHYLWLDKKPEVGDTLDMSQCLCVIEPPKFGV